MQALQWAVSYPDFMRSVRPSRQWRVRRGPWLSRPARARSWRPCLNGKEFTMNLTAAGTPERVMSVLAMNAGRAGEIFDKPLDVLGG
jgi:hypothetical protein